MKKLILLSIIILSFSFIFAYTAPSSDNVNLVLTAGYTAPDSQSANLVLGEEVAPTQCNPTLNQDFIITDEQVCDGVEVTSGTGQINITSGNLTLINGANFTARQLNIQTSGEIVFINNGSLLKLT